MNEPAVPEPTCGKCRKKLTDTKPHTAKGRRKYCDVLCRTAAWKRKKAGKPIADPLPELDELLAERNWLVAEVQTLQPQLQKSEEALRTATNTLRRNSYAVDAAEVNADKKISFHGAAIVNAHEQAEEAQRMAIASRDNATRLQDENAVLRDRLRETLARNEALRKQRPLRPKVQRTLATQVYFAFHQLAKDYREIRRGTDLDESDYRLFDHAARNRARLKLNGTDIDQRTLYYFVRLTRAAYQSAQTKNHVDANTTNHVKLYNTVNKLIALPTVLRPFGEITHIPEPTTSEQS